MLSCSELSSMDGWLIDQVEVSTGQFPYREWSSIFDQLMQVVQGDPPCLSVERDQFSPEFVDFVNTWWVSAIFRFYVRCKLASALPVLVAEVGCVHRSSVPFCRWCRDQFWQTNLSIEKCGIFFVHNFVNIFCGYCKLHYGNDHYCFLTVYYAEKFCFIAPRSNLNIRGMCFIYTVC